MFLKSDLFAFLTADINSTASAHEMSQGEIYTYRGDYSEIVGMPRRINLFKRFLPTGKFDGLAYEERIRFKRQSFSGNN